MRTAKTERADKDGKREANCLRAHYLLKGGPARDDPMQENRAGLSRGHPGGFESKNAPARRAGTGTS